MILWSAILVYVFTCQFIFTAAFLQNLLSPTTSSVPSTHISDFRKRPRSDSRADKSDGVPPLNDYEKTMEDRYMELFGKVIGIARNQFDKLADQVEERQKLRQYRESSSEQNDFGKLKLKIEIGDPADNTKNQKSNGERTFGKKHFSSLLAAIGLNKLQKTKEPEYLSKALGTAEHIVNPIFDIWQSVSDKKLKLKSSKRSNVQMEQQTESNDNNIQEEDDENGNVTPSTIPEASEVVDTVEDRGAKKKLALQNAFFKYLNWAPLKGVINENAGTAAGSIGIPMDNVYVNLDNRMDLNDADLPIIERIDNHNTVNENSNDDNNDDGGIAGEAKDDDDDDNNDNDNINGNGNENEKFDAETTALFVLEMIGTIAGLTWGAFSHLQNVFTRN